MVNSNVRVRFAPSPTGYPHLGNIRTALFNWLFSRHHKGTFILRIEDTDVARKVEGAVEIIMDSLRWLGMDWDEGPIFQSERLNMYREAAEKMVAGGYAYRCYCSSKRLEKMREQQTKNKQPTGYDRQCRDLSEHDRAECEKSGVVPVIRFKSPVDGQTSFNDLIRGDIVFENTTLDDFVLLKSDGYPTYHLANIVDDHFMQITHVLRAEEWVSSTPRHILLYKAMGWEPPLFAHLPMILGPDRSKLSKRHGATAINEYKEHGFLPETMLNFLTLLGWSLDDKTELMTREDIIKNFSLERISKTAAIFNMQKLEWMNGVYIRGLSIDDFAERVLPFLEKDLPVTVNRPIDKGYVRRILPLVQERAKTLEEVTSLTDFFFYDELEYERSLLTGKLELQAARDILKKAIDKLHTVTEWKNEVMENAMRPMCAELDLKPAVFFGMLRVAVTGRMVSPPLFQTMEVLGRERCFKRLNAALTRLTEH